MSIIIVPSNNIDSHSGIPQPILPDNSNTPSITWKKVGDVVKKVFDFFENVVWKYIQQIVGNLAKRVLKVISLTCTELAGKLSPIITRLGIVSAVSLILTLKGIPKSVESLIQKINLHDHEGTVFSALSLALTPLDALDSLITTMEALTAFGVVPQIAFFSLIGLPLAIGLSCYGAIKSVYDLIVNSIELHFIPKTLTAENREEVQIYLEKKIGITSEESMNIHKRLESQKEQLGDEYETQLKREFDLVKDRKRSIFTRHTDVKVYQIMQKLHKELQKPKINLTDANLALKDVKTIMVRKIGWSSAAAATNIALSASLITAAAFPLISPFALPCVLGVRGLVSVAKHHFEHVWMYKGLNVPEYAAG